MFVPDNIVGAIVADQTPNRCDGYTFLLSFQLLLLMTEITGRFGALSDEAFCSWVATPVVTTVMTQIWLSSSKIAHKPTCSTPWACGLHIQALIELFYKTNDCLCSHGILAHTHGPPVVMALADSAGFRGGPSGKGPNLQVDLQLAVECHSRCFGCKFWYNYSRTNSDIEVKQPPCEGKMITA